MTDPLLYAALGGLVVSIATLVVLVKYGPKDDHDHVWAGDTKGTGDKRLVYETGGWFKRQRKEYEYCAVEGCREKRERWETQSWHDSQPIEAVLDADDIEEARENLSDIIEEDEEA